MVVNVLSRLPNEPTAVFSAITSLSADIFQQLHIFFATHPTSQQLISDLQSSRTFSLHFSFHAGLIFYKQRVFIPQESLLIPSLLLEFHSTPIGGHSRVKATVAKLATTFYWSGMTADVKHFIANCSIYQYNKYDPHSLYGLLQPLPVPERVWDDISMDFITHSNSVGKTVIWVVVNKLSKYIHFISLSTGFSVPTLAPIFIS